MAFVCFVCCVHSLRIQCVVLVHSVGGYLCIHDQCVVVLYSNSMWLGSVSLSIDFCVITRGNRTPGSRCNSAVASQ